MRLNWLVSVLLLNTPWLSWSLDEPSPAGCEPHYSVGDPALFNFVETRRAVDFSRFAGMTIAGIEYVTLPIFNENDPKENYWLYRWANRLHIDTRASTLERQVAFAEGESLAPEKILESERILRGNEYLVDAMVLPQRVCGDQIYLLVVARDVWTLSPSADASRSGGDTRSGFGLSESNLLGTGQEVSVGYFSNSDRSGKNFAYRHPDIIGEHTQMSIQVEDNSDGDASSLSLEHPFYEFDTTWAAGFSYDERDQVETIERQDEEINKYREITKNASAYYGWSAGRRDGVVQRWKAGVTRSGELYESVTADVSNPPESRILRYPWLEWESIEDRFVTLSNITHSHRNEDLLVGFIHKIKLGYASQSWNSSENAWIYSAGTGYTAGLGEHHLLRMGISVDGRYDLDAEQPENTFYTGQMEYYNFPDHKRRWYARAKYTVGENIDDDDELSVGDSDTLRGYPSDYQRGNHQWLVTLESRYFTDIHILNLAYVGGAAYIDAGRTWDSTESNDGQSADTLANFGLGLRLSPSKFNIERVLHLDFAWPLVNRDEVDSYQLILSGRVDF